MAPPIARPPYEVPPPPLPFGAHYHSRVLVVCSWCKRELDEPSRESRPGRAVSHGICQKCAWLFEEFEPIDLSKLLDRFQGPVLLVDASGKVLAGNSAAEAYLDPAHRGLTGQMTGEVIECVHAREEAGCGLTVCCTGCTIRKTLRHTQRTGESQWGIEAFQYIFTPQGVEHTRVLITTERWRGRVLLRIDTIGPPTAA